MHLEAGPRGRRVAGCTDVLAIFEQPSLTERLTACVLWRALQAHSPTTTVPVPMEPPPQYVYTIHSFTADARGRGLRSVSARNRKQAAFCDVPHVQRVPCPAISLGRVSVPPTVLPAAASALYAAVPGGGRGRAPAPWRLGPVVSGEWGWRHIADVRAGPACTSSRPVVHAPPPHPHPHAATRPTAPR